MKRKTLFSKLTASVMSALMIFSAAPAFSVTTFAADTLASSVTAMPVTNTSYLEQSTVMKGKKAVVVLSSSGGAGSFKYSVYYKRSSAEKWTTAVTNTSEHTVSITPKYAEEYTISVKAVDSTGKYMKKHLQLNVLPSLRNDSALEQTKVIKGKPVVVDLAADGGSGNYKYSVYYRRSSVSKWTTAVTDTANTTVSITPKYAEEYTISVKAVDSLGNVKKKYLTLDSLAPVTNKSTVPQTTVSGGGTITINCAAENGSGSYKYSVFYKLTTSKTWKTLIQDTTKTTLYFTPPTAVSYDISVKAADTLGSVSKKYFTVSALSKLRNTSYADSEIIDFGEKITVHASAEGGKAPYTFAYYYKISTSTNWGRISDYTSTATLVLTPKYANGYDIQVYAKDADGNIESKIITVGVIGEFTNTSVINPSSVDVGNEIHIYPYSDGYYQSVSYQIYHTMSGSTAKTYITYDPSKSYALFKPSKAGSYTITVIAKDSLNRTTAKSFGVTVTENSLYNTVDSILAQIIRSDMNDFEKLRAIHDWMIKYADYDKENYYAGTIPQADYTAEGFFENRKAVCDGYSKAFLALATRAGFDAIRVEGTANGGDHAWNQVKANGNWYNIDVTWDDSIVDASYGDNLRYVYFLIPDSTLNKDHIATSSKYSCTAPQPSEWLSSVVAAEEVQQHSNYALCTTDAELTSAVKSFKSKGTNPFTLIWKTDEVDCSKIFIAYGKDRGMSFSYKKWKFDGYYEVTTTLQ